MSFELMHCVSTYPMKIEDANLVTINALKKDIIAKLAIVVMKVDWQFHMQLQV